MESDGMEVIRFLYSRWKTIATATVLASLASIAITSTLPKKYTSSAIFFPPSFKVREAMDINPQMGYNMEADRLIQMTQSSALRDSLIQRFDLLNYYNIDSTNVEWRDKIYNEIAGAITLERTKYMSVIIRVETKDPELSSRLANGAMDLLSRFWERLYKDNIVVPLAYAQNQYMEKNAQVSALLDSIHILRSGNKEKSLELMYGQLKSKEADIQVTMKKLGSIRESGEFYDYGDQMDKSQLNLITVQQNIASYRGRISALENAKTKNDTALIQLKGKLEGAEEAEKLLKKRIADLKSNGKEFEGLAERLELEMEQYQRIKAEYENLLHAFEPYVKSLQLESIETKYAMERENLVELKNNFEDAFRYFNQPLPNLFVMEYAKPSYQKSSPSYRLNFLIATVAGFIFSCIVLLFLDKFRQVRESMNK